MVADAVTVNSSGTFTLLNPTQITGRPPANKYFLSVSTTTNSSATSGTYLYYSLNDSGSCQGINLTYGVVLASETINKEAKASSSDVYYQNSYFYICVDNITSFYRWTLYSLTYDEVFTTESGSRSDTNPKYAPNESSIRIIYESDLGYYYSGLTKGIPTAGQWFVTGSARNVGKLYRFTSASGSNLNYDRCRRLNQTKSAATGQYIYALTSDEFPVDGRRGGFWYSDRTTIS